MTDINHRIRFAYDNIIGLPALDLDVSSEVSGFEVENAFDDYRSTTWKCSGLFQITAANNTIYINDGVDKTGNITIADYLTGTALATSIQGTLNTISSNWTVTYNNTAGTWVFEISHIGSATLRLTQTTNAIWSDIGFTDTVDLVGTLFVANEQRNHGNQGEFITVDLGYIGPVQFVSLLGPVGTKFPLSSNATVTLEANNINDFTSPPFSLVLTVTNEGIYQFNDTTPVASYRFYRLRIVDQFNVIYGPNIEFGNIFIGRYVTLLDRNISAGFTDTLIDPSILSESESGVLYADERTKYVSYDNIRIGYMQDADKQVIKALFARVGLTRPFYISLDPTGLFSTNITEFTRLVVFKSEPQITALGACFFGTVLNVREVI